ncbi:hypothetical protein DMENIID0001_086280 [Sergentomyia squamirostris]
MSETGNLGNLEDLEDSCRGCLKPDKSHLLFGEDNLHVKFKYCTQLKISRDDGFSSYLCKLCFAHLEVAYNFKNMCKETNLVMKNLKQTLPDKEENEKESPQEPDEQDEEILEYFEESANEEDHVIEPENTEEIPEKDLPPKHMENLLRCSLCHKNYSSSQALKIHIENTHKGVKKFICEICDQRFTQKHSLQSHLMRHTNEKPFSCDVCGKLFRRKQVLQMHMNCHTGKTPYHCDRCNMSFRTTTALRNHGHNLSCLICDKTFRMIPSLQAHIRRHKLEGGGQIKSRLKVRHICNECGKSFACKSVLDAHKIIHTGRKPFKCVKCDKSFPLEASLKVHMRKKHLLTHEEGK